MTRSPAVALVSPVLLLAGGAALASDASHDPRPLTAAESCVFVPLVCAHPQKMSPTASPASGTYRMPDRYRCKALIGRKREGETVLLNNEGMALSAIAYGSFTKPGADEAYISYDGLEPHTLFFGGGIVFERKLGRWSLSSWVPGERRQNCVALPDSAPQEMLCLESGQHGTESVAGFAVTLTAQHIDQHLRSSGEYHTSYKLSQKLVAISDKNFGDCKDMRDNSSKIDNRQDPCETYNKGTGFLEGFDDLKRSSRPGTFAEAKFAYFTTDDVEKVCKASCYLDGPYA